MSQTVRIAERSAAAGRATLGRVLQAFRSAAPGLPDNVPAAQRRQAANELERLGWPSWRDESWRYANVRAFESIERFAARTPPALDPTLALPPPLPGFRRMLFVDGVQLSTAAGTGTPVADAALTSATADQRLALVNDLFALDGVDLRIDGEDAIELLFVTSAAAAGGAVYPRLRLELAASARLQLVERHLGAPATSCLVCASGQIQLARGAQLTHYRLQQYGEQVLFFDTLAVRAAAEAEYRVRQVALGAATARTSAAIALAGRGASVSWQALALGRGDQVHDTALEVLHSAPATRTEEVFRGIADERARIAFAGHVHIDAAAAGADARQSLRGLIEGAGAEIDLRPRLEINTDEVSAQHGATTGRLDENLLFYLLARGLDREVARTLLKWAFLGDVLRAIEIPALRLAAERAAAGQLPDAPMLGELA